METIKNKLANKLLCLSPDLCLPTHCRCTGLLLHLITLNDTYTLFSRTLWTRDRPVAEASTWQHTTFTRDLIHDPGGIRTRNRSKQAAADPRLRPRGHQDQNKQVQLGNSIQLWPKPNTYCGLSRWNSVCYGRYPGREPAGWTQVCLGVRSAARRLALATGGWWSKEAHRSHPWHVWWLAGCPCLQTEGQHFVTYRHIGTLGDWHVTRTGNNRTAYWITERKSEDSTQDA